MKLAYSQFLQQLPQTSLYLICGDELLLVEEAAAAIHKAAKNKGYERTPVIAEGSDWGKELYAQAHSLSFFSDKKLIEINLWHLKINQAHGKILEDYVCHLPSDSILLILAAKMDAKAEKSVWYQTIDKQGVIVNCWPIPNQQLPQWIMERARKNNLAMHKEAAELLAEMVEGNLFAANQEIEKLALLQPKVCDVQTIKNSMSDHAQFDVFKLVDSALSGDRLRCIRIIESLWNMDMEPTLLLWALTRELRILADMKKNLAGGLEIAQVFNQFRVWDKRKPCVRAFLERYTVRGVWELLINAARIDRIIKGAEVGNLRNEIEEFALRIAGNGIIK